MKMPNGGLAEVPLARLVPVTVDAARVHSYGTADADHPRGWDPARSNSSPCARRRNLRTPSRAPLSRARHVIATSRQRTGKAASPTDGSGLLGLGERGGSLVHPAGGTRERPGPRRLRRGRGRRCRYASDQRPASRSASRIMSRNRRHAARESARRTSSCSRWPVKYRRVCGSL